MSEKELSLKNYINVMLEWKWLVICITVISMLIATVFVFISPEVYKGNAMLELPFIPQAQIGNWLSTTSNGVVFDGLSFSPDEIANFVKSNAFLEIISKDCKIPFSSIQSSLTVNPVKNTKILSITFENSDKDNIRKFFTDLMIKLQSSKYGVLYNKEKEFLTNYKISLQRQIQENEKILYSAKKVINLISQKMPDNVDSFLLYSKDLSEYSNLSDKQDVLTDKLVAIENVLNNAHGFNYISGVYVENKPVKPKKLFNIAVAGTAGFFFAILLAFFLEYMQGSEDKKRTEKTTGDSNK